LRAYAGRPLAVLASLIAVLVVAFLLLAALPAAADETPPSPFGQAPSVDGAQQPEIGWFDRLLIEIRAQQRALQKELASAVRATGEHPGTATLFTLVGLCFAYGVFHAVGPGHGKAVITAYALTNERIMWRGIGIALLAAFIQATTAVVLVYAVLLALSGTTRLITESVTVAEAVSFSLIAGMGAYLAIGGIRRLRRTRSDAHDHHGHDHGADDQNHDHMQMPDAAALSRAHGLRDAFALALVVGIRPCTGAILVLVFAYGLGLHAIGIVSSYAMGLGTGLSVAGLVAVASLVKLPQARAAERGRHWAQWFDILLRILGGAAILLLGLLLFWASVTGPPAPFAG
jgi:ABC-type nickel/cobalt efflux system permease component RcnA